MSNRFNFDNVGNGTVCNALRDFRTFFHGHTHCHNRRRNYRHFGMPNIVRTAVIQTQPQGHERSLFEKFDQIFCCHIRFFT